MIQPAYSAATAAASRIHPHLIRHLETAPPNETRAPVPDVDTIQSILDTAFWASLRREEGYAPRISLAFIAPEAVATPLLFERPLSFTPHVLTKVAPAVERPGIHLGVSLNDGVLSIWGATRKLPSYSFVLEVVSAGLLVVKQSREEGSGKFVNVAVIEGDQIKIIDERAASVPDCPSLLTSLLGLESRHAAEERASVLIQLAVSMRAHGRGGSLLVVPASSTTWRESMLMPITYAVTPAFAMLSDLIRDRPESGSTGRWKDAVRRVVDGIAGSTAVDGATIINDHYELLAFGAKIVRRKGSSLVSKVMLTEPIEGAEITIAEPTQLGGTRHLSAAQFAHDQHDAIAMVASQDGRFTVFGWSPCNDVVQAHRMEALLL